MSRKIFFPYSKIQSRKREEESQIEYLIYTYLLNERSRKQKEIKESLVCHCETYEFHS